MRNSEWDQRCLKSVEECSEAARLDKEAECTASCSACCARPVGLSVQSQSASARQVRALHRTQPSRDRHRGQASFKRQPILHSPSHSVQAWQHAPLVGTERRRMSYLLPHLHKGFAVDQAILTVSCLKAHYAPADSFPSHVCSGGGQGGVHALRARLGPGVHADGRGAHVRSHTAPPASTALNSRSCACRSWPPCLTR